MHATFEITKKDYLHLKMCYMTVEDFLETLRIEYTFSSESAGTARFILLHFAIH